MAILVLHNDQPSVDLLKQSADSSVVFSSTYIPNKWDCIIRWGNGKEPYMHQVELNRGAALRRLYSRAQAARCLAVNRIPFRRITPSSPRPRAMTAYRIHLVDMVPISVSSPRDGKFRPVIDYSSPRTDRAIRLARRVLYCLGLHFGRVDLGYTNKKVLRVLSVSAAPPVTKKLAALYMNALTVASSRRLSTRPIHADEVVLGADPEFMMVSPSTKRVVFASDFFGRDGLIGYDNQSYFRDRRNHPIAEIRPRPTASPAQLVREMKEALRLAAQKTAHVGTIWLAGSQPYKGYSTGGHIHFTGIPLTFQLVTALDNYLAIPCMLLENTIRAASRRPRYGFLGDVRTKSHGGFEYRTLASWLVSQRLAEAILYLAKLVVVEHKSLQAEYLGSIDAAADFYRAKKDRFRPYVARLWADIERTRYYEVCKNKIRIIKTMIDRKRTWRDRADIRASWGLLS